VGRVVAKGKGVQKFGVGDIVASPFSLSCGKSSPLDISVAMLTSNLGDCFYCQLGNTARCVKSRAFGTPTADGGQAEYINLSMADSSLFKAPEGMPIDLMVLMTDIILSREERPHSARKRWSQVQGKDSVRRDWVWSSELVPSSIWAFH
jgi:threonine dehydrogenase-like Zn-dependent dehydrogenase